MKTQTKKLQKRQTAVLINALLVVRILDKRFYDSYLYEDRSRSDHGFLGSTIPRKIAHRLDESRDIRALHPTEVFAVRDAMAITDATGIRIGRPVDISQIRTMLETIRPEIEVKWTPTRVFRVTPRMVNAFEETVGGKSVVAAEKQLSAARPSQSADLNTRLQRLRGHLWSSECKDRGDSSLFRIERWTNGWMGRAERSLLALPGIFVELHEELIRLEAPLIKTRDRSCRESQRLLSRVRRAAMRLSMLIDWAICPNLRDLISLEAPLVPRRKRLLED